jgi:hypothetical protein
MVRVFINRPEDAPPGVRIRRSPLGRLFYTLEDVRQAAQDAAASHKALEKFIRERLPLSEVERAQEIVRVASQFWFPAQRLASEIFKVPQRDLPLRITGGLPELDVLLFYTRFRDAQAEFFAKELDESVDAVKHAFWLWDGNANRSVWRLAFDSTHDALDEGTVQSHPLLPLIFKLAEVIRSLTTRFLQELSVDTTWMAYHMSEAAGLLPGAERSKLAQAFPPKERGYAWAVREDVYWGSDWFCLTLASLLTRWNMDKDLLHLFAGNLPVSAIVSTPWTGPGNFEAFEVISRLSPPGIHLWLYAAGDLAWRLPWLLADDDLPSIIFQLWALAGWPGLPMSSLEDQSYEEQAICDITEWPQFWESTKGRLAILLSAEKLGIDHKTSLEVGGKIGSAMQEAELLSDQIVSFHRRVRKPPFVFSVVLESTPLRREKAGKRVSLDFYGFNEHAMEAAWGRSPRDDLTKQLFFSIPKPENLGSGTKVKLDRLAKILQFADILSHQGTLWPFFELSGSRASKLGVVFENITAIPGDDNVLAIPVRDGDKTIAAYIPVGPGEWYSIQRPVFTDPDWKGKESLLFRAGISGE